MVITISIREDMKKILVVDDNQDILELITLLLEIEGYEVMALNNGYELAATIKRFHPDILIMDVMLGSLDGRDLCFGLKQDARTSGIPIIMMSASHDLKLSVMTKPYRPNDFLAKPFDIECLIEKVQLQFTS